MDKILPLIIGYLLGSILPGYFIPKWIKGVDIRTLGDGNPGTTNAKRTVGLDIAILTGLYDTTKGLMAMFIARELFSFHRTYILLIWYIGYNGSCSSILSRFQGRKRGSNCYWHTYLHPS